jgi:uncharacterized protein (TIGR03067 family)
VALSAGMLAALTRQAATAAMAAELAQRAVQTGLGYLAGRPGAQRAAELANRFLQAQARGRWVKGASLLGVAGLLAALVLVLLLGHKAPTDAELLQGTWHVAKVRLRGQELPAANLEMIFAGERVTLRSPLLPPNAKTFRLDPSKDPKEIDVILPDGRVWPGIYRLEADALQLCLNTEGRERPTRFSPERFFATS